jgi:hypothetical protein
MRAITKTVRQNLAAIVAAYRKATGASLAQVSKEFYGNSTFFKELNERQISVTALDDILDKFRDKWPENADWPLTRVMTMNRNKAG